MDQQRSLGILTRLLQAAEGCTAQLVIVRGPAGCGKSTMVRRFMENNKHLAAWTSGGARWERDMAGSALQEIVDSSNTANALPLPERLLAFLKTVGKRTGIVLVENLQWADAESLAALMFAWRRLRNERVLVILTLREEEAVFLPSGASELIEAPGSTTIELDPPSAAALKEISAARLGIELSTAAADQLAAYTAGNIHTALDLIRENPDETWSHLNHRFPCHVRHRPKRPRGWKASPRRPGPSSRQHPSWNTVPAWMRSFVWPGSRTPCHWWRNVWPPDWWPWPETAETSPWRSRDDRADGRLPPIPLSRRLALHGAAAAQSDCEGTALAHRADATLLSDPALSHQLELYAAKQAKKGAWSSAAVALHRAAGLATDRAQRDPLFLRAVDATVAAGELPSALACSDELASLAASPARDLLSGYIAILQGLANTADRWLASAWKGAAHSGLTEIMATVAQRRVLDALGRVDGPGLVAWAEKTLELAIPKARSPWNPPPSKVWAGHVGQAREGDEMLSALLTTLPSGRNASAPRWPWGGFMLPGTRLKWPATNLQAPVQPITARDPTALHRGPGHGWPGPNSRPGTGTQALETVRTAVALQERSGIELVRPLLHHTAVLSPTPCAGNKMMSRPYLAKAWARTGSYEVMQVPYRMARASAARARADYDEVILALEPLLSFERSGGIDEPGFWPWQDTYPRCLGAQGPRGRGGKAFGELSRHLPANAIIDRTRRAPWWCADRSSVRGRVDIEWIEDCLRRSTCQVCRELPAGVACPGRVRLRPVPASGRQTRGRPSDR